MSPLAVARFEQELRSALQAEAERNRDASRVEEHKARLVELAKDIARVVDAVTKVGVSDALEARLKELEAEKLTLEAVLHSKAAAPLDIERLVRQTMQSYDEVVATIEDALEEDIELARDALSKLLGRITLTVDADGAVWADLENNTARLPSGAGLPVSLTVVAGAGPSVPRAFQPIQNRRKPAPLLAFRRFARPRAGVGGGGAPGGAPRTAGPW